MTLESKYKGGEIVYIVNYSDGRIHFQQSRIVDVSGWDKFGGFMYDVKFTTEDDVEHSTRISENEVYLSREEILTDLILDDYTKENEEEQTEPTNEEEQTNEQ